MNDKEDRFRVIDQRINKLYKELKEHKVGSEEYERIAKLIKIESDKYKNDNGI